MCPDAELLSAWTDGEVPSPWKERIAAHLADCPLCSEKVAGFKRLALKLRSLDGDKQAAVVGRIAARLGLDGGAVGPVTLAPRIVPITGRRIAISLPVAATAAAALLVAGAFSFSLVSRGGNQALAIAPNSSAAAGQLANTAPSPNATMESLVRYLESQNAPVSVTIQLPSGTAFANGGTPMIVKSPPVQMVSNPPSNEGLGFVMQGEGK